MGQDQVSIPGLPVRGQPHNLVFPGVDLKTGKIGKGGIQQTQGMRKAKFGQQIDGIIATYAPGSGGHFPTPSMVRMAARLKGRGVEGAGRMGLVMFRKQQRAVIPQFLLNLLREPEFFLDPEGHGLQEGTESSRGKGQRRLQEAFKFQEREGS